MVGFVPEFPRGEAGARALSGTEPGPGKPGFACRASPAACSHPASLRQPQPSTRRPASRPDPNPCSPKSVTFPDDATEASAHPALHRWARSTGGGGGGAVRGWHLFTFPAVTNFLRVTIRAVGGLRTGLVDLTHLWNLWKKDGMVRRVDGRKEGGAVTTRKYKHTNRTDTLTEQKEAKPFDNRGFRAHVWGGINLLRQNLERPEHILKSSGK